MNPTQLAIYITARAAEARREIAKVRYELMMLDKQAETARQASNREYFQNLTRQGSRMGWLGRQMTANITAPILLATAAGIKWGLDLEKAMTRMKKVYGSSADDAARYSSEIDALARNFTALSNRFGIAREEVADIGAEWAAAGSSGAALAKQVRLTMQTMVLGEMEATDATRALIAIQAQWGQDTEGLTYTLQQLNTVENQTGTTMKDLVEVFEKASGTARTAGLDTAHLAAMAAALVPAAGSAEEAGTALRTMLNRLMTPTKDSAEVLGAMNIKLDSAGWQSLNAAQRMEKLAEATTNLTGGQKQQVAALVASRWQINKFDVLMKALTDDTSYYHKALEALADPINVINIAERELNTVLESNPQRAKIAGTIMKNSLVDAIAPVIPLFIQLSEWIAKAMNWFADLPVPVRSAVLAFALLIATLGPLVLATGLAMLVFAQLAPRIGVIAKVLLLPLAPLKLLGVGFRVLAIGMAVTSHAAIGAVAAFSVGTVKLLTRTAAVFSVVSSAFSVAMKAIQYTILGAALLYPAFFSGLMAMYHGFVASMLGASKLYGATMIGLMSATSKMWRAYFLNLLSLQKIWATASFVVLTTYHALFIAAAYAYMAARLVIQKAYNAASLAITAAWAVAHAFAINQGFLGGRKIYAAGLAAYMILEKAFLAALAGFHAVSIAARKVWASAMVLVDKRMWIAIVAMASSGFKALWIAVAKGGAGLIRLFASPWLLAVAAVVAILVGFRDQIKQAYRNIVAYFQNLPQGIRDGLAPLVGLFNRAKQGIINAFNALPEGVRNALMAVVRIVAAVARKVYELFQYLNPFARHSPSLVENVQQGMAVISGEFADAAKSAESNISRIKDAIASLRGASEGLKAGNTAAAEQEFLKNVNTAGASSSLPAYNQLKNEVAAATKELEQMNLAIERQKAVVDGLQREIDQYDKTLAKMNSSLEVTKAIQESVNKQMQAAQNRYDRFASAQIEGSLAAEDAAFSNEMAQKRLQLQIAKMEDEAGSVDSVADAYSRLQGEIELLQGTQADLRSAGAGSDILAPYQASISKLQSQQQGLMAGTDSGPASKIQAMRQQLEALQKQAEIMDLERALKFDPLNRQLEKFKSNVEEMPFGQIMSGLQANRSSVDALTFAYDSLGSVADSQQQAIDVMQAKRDTLGDTYDAENAKLETLNTNYSALEETINSGQEALDEFANSAQTASARIEQALQAQEEALRAQEQAAEDARQTMLSGIRLGLGPGANKEQVKAAQDAKDLADAYASLSEEEKKAAAGGAGSAGGEVSAAMQNFQDSALGDYTQYGEGNIIQREGGPGDQTSEIDALTAGIQEELSSSLGGMNPFQFIIDWWNKTKDWLNQNIAPSMPAIGGMFTGIGQSIKDAFVDDGGESPITKLQSGFESLKDTLGTVWEWIQKGAEFLGRLFGPDLQTTIQEVKDGFASIWEKAKPALEDFIAAIGPFVKALLPYLAWIVGVIIAVFETLWEVINGLLGPVFNFLGDLIRGVIQIITGAIRIITGVLDIVMGIVQTVIGLIRGLITGDFTMFTDGLSKIWDGIKNIFGGIVDIFKGLGGVVVSLIVNAAKAIWNAVWGLIKGVIDFFKSLWDTLVGHSIIPDTINAIVDWFLGLPGKVLEFIGNFIVNVITFFAELPGRIMDALKELGLKLFEVFLNAFVWLVTRGPDLIVDLIGFFVNLPFRLIEALGDLGGKLWEWGKAGFNWFVEHGPEAAKTLFDFGVNIIQGLLDGAGSLLSKIGEFFLDKIPGWIKEPFKKALGIESPSTVFAGYGKNIGEGLIAGMDTTSPAIQASAQDMANAAANIDVPAIAAPTQQTDSTTTQAQIAEFQAFSETMQTEVGSFALAIQTAFASMAVEIDSSFQTVYTGATEKFAALATDLPVQVTLIESATKAQVSKFVDVIRLEFERMTEGVVEQFNQMGIQVEPILKAFTDDITKRIEDMLNLMVENHSQHFKTVAESWTDLATALSTTVTDEITPIFDSVGELLTTMEENFATTVSNVGTVWEGLKEEVAEPARFVVDRVYNDGIRGAWNKVNTWLELPPLEDFKANFYSGGKVFGQPGIDKIPAMLTHNEHVVTDKEVRGAGGHAAVEAQRALWAQGVRAFASGGPVRQDAPPWSGGGGEEHLKPAAILARRNIHMYWPQISTIGGYRASDPYPDHPSGLALDVMTYDPAGTEVNDWLHREMNALALNYTIWKQMYRPAGGRPSLMEDRGSPTQNHMDHVHALFNNNGVPGIGEGGVGGGTSGPSIAEMVEQAFEETMRPIRDEVGVGLEGVNKIREAGFNKFHDDVKKFLMGKAAEKDALSGAIGGLVTATGSGPVVEQVKKAMEPYGWHQGAEWNALDQLIAHESSWNPNAQNPGSTAYGLFQFLDSTWATVGGTKTSDPYQQAVYGGRYIKGRYGTPSGAWSFWNAQSPHWYDAGGMLPTGTSLVHNQTGGPEAVLTTAQWQAMYRAASGDPIKPEDLQDAVVNANVITGNTGDAQADAIIKGLDVWQKSWTPALYDATNAVVESTDKNTDATNAAVGTTKLLDKTIGKWSEQIKAFSAMMVAISNASSGEQTFDAWVPVINAAADFIDTLPYQERDWQADNPVPGETEAQRKQRIATNNIQNYAKGAFNVIKDVGPVLLRHTAIIGSAITRLMAEDAPIWTAGLAALATGNPMGAVILIPVILKAIFTILPLILAAIMDIVPALIRAIVRFLTQFMPDSVFAYSDMASAEAAVAEQQAGGAIAMGQGQRYPEYLEGSTSGSGNAPVTLNIYGDVNLPNVTNAQEFADQLNLMAAT